MKKPVALIVLDGWGINHKHEGNAVYAADTHNFDRYLANYPNTELQASGLAVGLPDGQMGNSEVGHLNIGAGRVVYQELTRITKSIQDGDFFEKEEFIGALENAKKNNTDIHLMGLLSDGGVHSHMNHVKGLLDFFKKNNFDRVYVHPFLDGRDTPPTSALGYVDELETYMNEIGVGKIATVSGRYYAMDRDKRWDRVEKAYDAIVNAKGEKAATAHDAIQTSYNNEVNDEFVLPTIIEADGTPVAQLKENDSVIFFNFRPDRARELSRAIVDADFDSFKNDYFKTEYVCFTTYDVTLPNVKVAFKPTKLHNTLGEVLSEEGLKQLRIAETEKYAHVTFFFNGGVEAPNEGEDRLLVQSPDVATYDLQPEMSAFELTDKLIEQIRQDKYDVIILNYANPDMVGHTGVFEAAKKAVETVDTCLAKVVDAIIEKGGAALITADHGNAETMVNYDTGKPFTAHTTNVVPLVVAGLGDVELRNDGKLSDLAPTVLEILKVNKPEEMTGTTVVK